MMGGGPVLRPARADDVPTLAEVEVAAGVRFRDVGLDAVADDDPPTDEELLAHVDDGTAWVAELDGQVVGYALAACVDGEGHLHQVSVRPEHAGQGVGRALVDQVLAWARHRGHHTVTLTTFRDVAWNGPWYRHLGFEDLAEEELGPELAAVRRDERANGLDVAPRVAMRRRLDDRAAPT